MNSYNNPIKQHQVPTNRKPDGTMNPSIRQSNQNTYQQSSNRVPPKQPSSNYNNTRSNYQ